MTARPSNPSNPEAFTRMLRDMAASIDRARQTGPVTAPAPPRPVFAGQQGSRGADATAPKAPPAAPIWPPGAGAALRKPEGPELPNPYDLLKEHSRAQERAAAKLLKGR